MISKDFYTTCNVGTLYVYLFRYSSLGAPVEIGQAVEHSASSVADPVCCWCLVGRPHSRIIGVVDIVVQASSSGHLGVSAGIERIVHHVHTCGGVEVVGDVDEKSSPTGRLGLANRERETETERQVCVRVQHVVVGGRERRVRREEGGER